jgi:hypothetical protein
MERFLVKIIVFFIRVYQKTLSMDHGLLSYLFPYGYCRFFPSCSQYAVIALNQYGLIKGLILAFLRIVKCLPFNKGGFDPVPCIRINNKKFKK